MPFGGGRFWLGRVGFVDMELVVLILFPLTALALPGCVVLMVWGAFRVRRGLKQKARKDVVLGVLALVVGLVVLAPGTYFAVWLYTSGATLGTGWN